MPFHLILSSFHYLLGCWSTPSSKHSGKCMLFLSECPIAVIGDAERNQLGLRYRMGWCTVTRDGTDATLNIDRLLLRYTDKMKSEEKLFYHFASPSSPPPTDRLLISVSTKRFFLCLLGYFNDLFASRYFFCSD